MNGKKMLIIGKDLGDYSRKWVFIEGFKSNFEVEVADLDSRNRYWWKFLSEIFRRGRTKDYIMVMQVAQEFAWPLLIYCFLRFFSRQTLIVDAHISLYDTFVFDRQLTPRVSLKAFYYYLLDFIVCHLADILIFDTKGHEDYFVRTFKVRPRVRKMVLPVAVDLEGIMSRKMLFSSGGKLSGGRFNVLFWGYYIPLQGIEIIVKAASLLKDQPEICFTLIGKGQTRPKIESLVKELKLDNIILLNSIEYEEIFNYIFEADLCLGIFGKTDKARRVIPNKLLEALACGKITITGRNRDMENYFQDGRDLIYCELGSPEDLANKIRIVYHNYKDYQVVGENAIGAIKKDFSLNALREKIKVAFLEN